VLPIDTLKKSFLLVFCITGQQLAVTLILKFLYNMGQIIVWFILFRAVNLLPIQALYIL